MSTTRSAVEQAVRRRYSAAAGQRADELCCPVEYDSRYLQVIPREIVERDYGCGDPSRHLRRGEVVLDLGSGGGKACYIAAQRVGAEGRVIGIDMNDEMLQLADTHREAIAERLGYSNVSFHKAKIQDLSLDYRKLEDFLADHPVGTVEEWERLETWKSDQRRRSPLIADRSVDVVVSNCVLNLVPAQDKPLLFREIHRVLREGGRAVISDIVCDEDVPAELQADPQLWSGCLSGAFREDLLLRAFEEAGFHGMRILERDETPWRVVQGIEFRSITLEALKGEEGACLELNQAVIYRGPWRSVTDDDGHTLHRGQRMAVCDRTFRLYTDGPYATEILPVPPRVGIRPERALPFDGRRDSVRTARQTKGEDYRVTSLAGSPCCGPGNARG